MASIGRSSVSTGWPHRLGLLRCKTIGPRRPPEPPEPPEPRAGTRPRQTPAHKRRTGSHRATPPRLGPGEATASRDAARHTGWHPGMRRRIHAPLGLSPGSAVPRAVISGASGAAPDDADASGRPRRHSGARRGRDTHNTRAAECLTRRGPAGNTTACEDLRTNNGAPCPWEAIGLRFLTDLASNAAPQPRLEAGAQRTL